MADTSIIYGAGRLSFLLNFSHTA
eukprot:SAG11_NODE_5857_length_1447_cov_1.292285_1_plen_23_part_01